MKILLKFSLILAIASLVACGDDETPGRTLEASDIRETLERPLANGDQIGTINVNTSEADPQFTITSQNPAEAVEIENSTGIIRVKDIYQFDFDNEGTVTGVVTVTAGPLTDVADFEFELSKLTSFELAVIEYFKDIALGFEFGGASAITRRWESEMRIYVGGTPTPELSDELDKIIVEINELTNSNSFSATLVDSRPESNYYIFFGSGDQYAAEFPDLASLVESNWGLFTLFWNGANQINQGYMYVDIFRASELEQLHLLREELTQSLGLARDSDQYANSIFQQSFNTKTTEYAMIDEELIRLLYHPDMRIGLNEFQVDGVLRDILASD